MADGPAGEDLCAVICTRKNGETAMEMFDITKDGCCEAKRPGNVKKKKKWKPDCAIAGLFQSLSALASEKCGWKMVHI